MTAIFAVLVLSVNTFYVRPVEAQLSFVVSPLTTFTGNVSNQDNCQYISSTEVWCSSASGIKIINPKDRTITNTLYSGIAIQDIECSASLCWSWHNGDTATANLTGWTLGAKTKFNSTTFTMSGGANVGRSIDLATATGSVTLIVPSSASSCISGASNVKGLCIVAGDTFQKTRYISSTDTGASAVVINIKWSESLASIQNPTFNNALVAFQDGAGTKTLRIIDLSDSDTTFAGTQTCLSGSIPALDTTAIVQAFVFGTNYYYPIDNGATGYYAQIPISSITCATTVTYPTTWDRPTSLMTDGELFYTSSYDGATKKSAMQVYNSTSVAIATYNITNTSGSAQQTSNGWYHSTESEIQIIRGSNLVVFSIGLGGNNTGSIVCIDTTGDAEADLCFTDTNGDGVADTGGQIGGLSTYRTGSNFTEFGNDIFCAFGINENACSDRNAKTNGVGYAFTILIIVFSYALLVSIHIMGQKMLSKENIQVIDALNIHPILLLVMLIFDVGLAFSLGFIDNVIFYTTIVVLIGLAGFGIYRKVVSG